MPRKPGFNVVGIPQHVIQRGNNREPCFYSKQERKVLSMWCFSILERIAL
jgi:hypothetical protein